MEIKSILQQKLQEISVEKQAMETLSAIDAKTARVGQQKLPPPLESTEKIAFSGKIPPEPKPRLEKRKALAGLTGKQKEQLANYCLSIYSSSAYAFEEAASEAAAAHPHAKEFSQELIRRLHKVVKAYHEVKKGEGRGELDLRLAIAREFSIEESSGPVAGSVGFNPIAIEKVIEEGSLSEQMTLIYTVIWTTLPKIFEDPDMVRKINEKLEGDFQLNDERIGREREEGNCFFPKAKPLEEFRSAGGRVEIGGSGKHTQKLGELKGVTLRQARTAAEDYLSEKKFKEGAYRERVVEWIRGKDMFMVDFESDFYIRALQLGGLPVVTGPSGTADSYLNACDYLNMQEYGPKALLALTGWMVRGGDHSLHEIRTAGSWHGIDYPQGPEGFESLFEEAPGFREAAERNLNKKGFKLPSHYLSEEFLARAAQNLAFSLGGVRNRIPDNITAYTDKLNPKSVRRFSLFEVFQDGLSGIKERFFGRAGSNPWEKISLSRSEERAFMESLFGPKGFGEMGKLLLPEKFYLKNISEESQSVAESRKLLFQNVKMRTLAKGNPHHLSDAERAALDLYTRDGVVA